MKRKGKKENPLTTFRKLNEARMGRVMDSYPNPADTPPLYDLVETFPVRKGIAGYSERYQPLTSYKEKKAAERAQRRSERKGKKSFRGDDLKIAVIKAKGKLSNPDLKNQICDPSGGITEGCVRGGKGGRKAQKRRSGR